MFEFGTKCETIDVKSIGVGDDVLTTHAHDSVVRWTNLRRHLRIIIGRLLKIDACVLRLTMMTLWLAASVNQA